MKTLKSKIKPYTTFKALEKKWMKDPEFKRGYESLALNFILIRGLMDWRIAGKTIKQLAQKMKVKQSLVSRFEVGKYDPTLSFIQKLVYALNIKIKEVKVRESSA